MASFILRYRNWLFLTFCLFSLLGIAGIFKLRINFSFDKFFPQQDEAVQFFRQYERIFPQNDPILYVALQNPKGSIFQQEFLMRERQLREQISALPHIDSVYSLSTLPEVKRTALGFIQPPLLRTQSEKQLQKSREKILKDDFLKTTFVSTNENWMSLFVQLDAGILDSPERDQAYDDIKAALEAKGLPYKISGIPGIRTQYVRKVTLELAIFISLSLILIVSFLYLVFRTWWGILFPLLGVIFPVIWLLGLMGWLGMELDLLTTLLPSLLFIVGTSDVIHLISKFLQEYRKGHSQLRSLFITVKEIGWLTFLTSFSTAVSLASLYTSALKPVQDFGIYSGLGVMLAFILTYLLLPALIMWLPESSLQKVTRTGLIRISGPQRFGQLWEFTLKHQQKILKGSLIIGILGLAGSLMVSENIRLLDDLGEGDQIRQDLTFFENEFTGVRSLEVAIHLAPNVDPGDMNFLQDLEKIERFLKATGKCQAIVSLPDLYRRGNLIWHFQKEDYNRLPSDTTLIREIRILAENTPVYRTLYNDSARLTRISARMRDLGSEEMENLSHALRYYIQNQTDTSRFTWELTGTAILFEKNNQYLTSGLFSGLVLSALIICLSMATLFASLRILFLSLIPNLLPILVLGGVMGFFGISLKASTVIVVALCFGIAFDDTIHFLGRLKLEMRKGYSSRSELMQRTLKNCGEGLILTTLVLTAGFLILLASDFGGTFYIGLFSCVTLLVALICDLLLLPLILLKYLPEKYLKNLKQIPS
jgi:hydrophobe/amphiphile efflux-3 (HAE3) family protein